MLNYYAVIGREQSFFYFLVQRKFGIHSLSHNIFFNLFQSGLKGRFMFLPIFGCFNRAVKQSDHFFVLGIWKFLRLIMLACFPSFVIQNKISICKIWKTAIRFGCFVKNIFILISQFPVQILYGNYLYHRFPRKVQHCFLYRWPDILIHICPPLSVTSVIKI